MSTDDIMTRLTSVFRQVFGDDALVLSEATTAHDIPGWDSLRMVSIVVSVEKAFGVRLRSREVDKLACVADFVHLLAAKLGTA